MSWVPTPESKFSRQTRARIERGLPNTMRLLLWFARNLDEELTNDDIAVRFDLDADAVYFVLYRLKRDGLLSSKPTGERPRHFTWTAGPRLLKECGYA